MWKLVSIGAFALLAFGCGSEPAAQEPQVVAWRSLGAWSGRGNAQTGSFVGDTGTFRVRWATNSETGAGAGSFQLSIHGAFTGLPLQVAVDHRGAGQDVAYIQQEPNTFHLIIDSANIDWSFTLEEAAPGYVDHH